jgi:hypothetical protein
LRQLEAETGFSRSKLSRMPKDQLDSLANAVADGTWRKHTNGEEAPACPGTLAQFENRFLAAHSLTAMIAPELRDSRPDIAAKLDAILAANQPWVDWLESN